MGIDSLVFIAHEFNFDVNLSEILKLWLYGRTGRWLKIEKFNRDTISLVYFFGLWRSLNSYLISVWSEIQNCGSVRERKAKTRWNTIWRSIHRSDEGNLFPFIWGVTLNISARNQLCKIFVRIETFFWIKLIGLGHWSILGSDRV